MKRDIIFHALISTLYQRQDGVRGRLLKDPSDIALGKGVPDGARFSQWLTHDDDDEVFDFLRSQDLLGEDVAGGGADAIIIPLQLDYPTLGEQQLRQPISDHADEGWLIGCFIEHALRLEEDPVIGSVRVAGLPIQRHQFDVPAYYDEAMRELANAGYCHYRDGRAQWLPKMAPIMEARGFWVGGRTRDEIRRERLAEVWTTMPVQLKQLTLFESDYPHAMVLACFMGHFWQMDSGWTFAEGDLHPDLLDTLKGGHLPDAAEISAMVKDGVLSRSQRAF
jgi:hypothetical protein